jgi:hydrogenase maturation protease
MRVVELTGVSSILLIGYGNISRRDDGVALHMVRRLRQRMGLPQHEALDEDEIELASGITCMFLHQLAPELAETVAEYDAVVFLDAHVEGVGWRPVHWQSVGVAYQSGMNGHHLKPATILALTQGLFGRCPQGYVLSVLGEDFDFGDQLTPATSARADLAVDRLEELIRSCGLWPARAGA